MATLSSNVTVGRVTIVDPNNGLSVQPNTLNGTPPEELLRPYVSLSVFRRQGAALSVDSQGRYDLREDAATMQVNMLDFDPVTGYSESYLDDVVGRSSRNTVGGFGIKSLSIKLNANYVPEVSITFLDLHAGSLFRAGSEGPLAVIYDYPPPLYKLTVKGAYGKYVEYVLHQVKETNNFGGGAANGTPEITVQFVGQYFGPMTDVLVGYLQAVPYLKGGGIVGANALGRRSSGPPTSFYDLVQRGKLLYSTLDAYKDQSSALVLTNAYTKLSADLTKLRGVLREKTSAVALELALRTSLVNAGAGALGGVLQVNPAGEVRPPSQLVIHLPAGALAAYDATTKVGNGEKLILAGLQANVFGPLQGAANLASGTQLARQLDFAAPANTNKLYGFRIHRSPDGPYAIVYDFVPLIQQLNELESQVAQQGGAASATVLDDVQARTDQLLGLRPTVGSIIKLVCDDYDYLLDRIRQAGLDPKPEPERRESDGARVVGRRTGQLPWPTVYEARVFATDNTKGQETLRYPGLYPGFADWPEVQLVEAYARACVEAAQDAQRTDAVQLNLNPNYYVPISPLERLGDAGSVSVINPYLAVESVYELVRMLVTRYAFSADFAYSHIFHVASSCITSSLARSFFSAGFTASPVDTVDGSTYGVINATSLANISLPTQSQRRQLIEQVARLDAGNAARGMKGKKTLVDGLLALPKTGPADLLAHLHLVTDPVPLSERPAKGAALVTNLIQGDAPVGEVNRDAVVMARYANGLIPSLTLDGGIKVYYRGGVRDDMFEGLGGIVKQNSTDGKILGTVKAAAQPGDNAAADPVGTEAAAFLTGISETFFSGKEKALISSANVLLYPDYKAAHPTSSNGDVRSDFFLNEGVDFYETLRIVLAGLQLTGNHAQDLNAIMSGLFSHIFYFYNQAKGFRNVLFGRFFYPGAIEMPTWYVAYLALITKGAGPYQADPYPVGEAPLGELDKERVLLFVADFVQGGGVGDLLVAYQRVAALGLTPVQQVEKLSADPAWQAFTAPVYLINTSTQTFLKLVDNEEYLNYRAKKEDNLGFHTLTNDKNKVRTPFSVYATVYWAELTKLLKADQAAAATAAVSTSSPLGDADFKTQIYYSFKSLYDRCLAGLTKPAAPLYDSFKFITRSYQDISNECIVDFHNFLDDAVDPEVSVYTAISHLLQKNGFLFFPLHSFVDFGSAGDDPAIPYWGGNFGLVDHLSDKTTARAAFVCMLVGSYSSQLNNVNNQEYPDDGFSFGDGQPPDFKGDQAAAPVVAFRVRVGLQNQSVFSEPRIDSAEFKNTDVSFKLQDEIINKQATGTYRVRKSQSLLNVYAQRSYVCSLGVPLGNMCLQPTQYFQLDGLNLYGGAYLIQEVSHEYSAQTQRLQTDFKGIRVGRHVFGVVSDPLLDYVGGGISPAFGASTGVSQGLGVSIIPNDARLLSKARLRQLCLDPANGFGYPVAMAEAVISTESRGNKAFNATTNKCIVRFEPTHFLAATEHLPGGARLVGATYLKDASGQILRTSKGRPRLNETLTHRDQTSEYAALAQAEAIDKKAAWESASWGEMQILGSNHTDAGYPGPNGVFEMVAAFQKTEESQVVAAFKFIASRPAARRAMVRTPIPDFAGFAAAYNGAYYAQNNYDVLLAAAYKRNNLGRDPSPSQILVVRREQKLADRVIGVITHLGEHVCYSLEDTVRPQGVFVAKQTAIEPGLYMALITKSPKLERETVVLVDVPGHSNGNIRIHFGGNPDASLGCILTGYDLDDKTHELHRQREAEDAVTKLVGGMLRQGDVYVNVS